MKRMAQALPFILRDSSGQSLVEAAIAIPVLVTLLLGTAELTRVIRAAVSVSNAAKASVQYGCQSGYTAQDSTGIQSAASAEAPNLQVTATPAISCICSDGTASSCSYTDCSQSHVKETLTVTTKATVTPSIHLPGLPATYTVKGQASQVVLQ